MKTILAEYRRKFDFTELVAALQGDDAPYSDDTIRHIVTEETLDCVASDSSPASHVTVHILDEAQQTEQAYIESKGMHCPHCGAHNIRAEGDFDQEGLSIHQSLTCGDCGSTWTEMYTLAKISNLKTPAPKT